MCVGAGSQHRFITLQNESKPTNLFEVLYSLHLTLDATLYDNTTTCANGGIISADNGEHCRSIPPAISINTPHSLCQEAQLNGQR